MITGEQIREARARLGWTLEELEQRTNIPALTIARIEADGGTPCLPLGRAFALQNALRQDGGRATADHIRPHQ